MTKDEIDMARMTVPEDRTPEQAACVAQLDAIKAKVGKNDNARALLVADVVLELADAASHTSEATTELARITGIIKAAEADSQTAILGQ